MKCCTQCKQTLPFASFDVQSTGKDGRRADCKDCRKRFTRTKEGLIKQIYGIQRAKSKKRDYALPNYSEQELLDWATAQPTFQALFQAWEMADYATNLKPSIDRLDDFKSYTLTNIQLLTWEDNCSKGYQAQLSGTNTKKSEAVDMLDLSGNFIERFHSVSAAARKFNGVPSNIIGVINKRITRKKLPDGTYRSWTPETAYGHKWQYASQPNDNSEKF